MATGTVLVAVLTLSATWRLCSCFVEAPSTEERFQALSTRLEQVEADLQSLKSQPCACANSSGTQPVAFHATLSKPLVNIGPHQHVVFDKAITNVGNAYNAVHGFFKAPVKGVYAFFVTITNVPQHSASLNLFKNGKDIGHVLAHGTSANPSLYVTSTLAATTSLEAGDEVWLQNEVGPYTTVEEVDGYGWSYFTGHIIAEM